MGREVLRIERRGSQTASEAPVLSGRVWLASCFRRPSLMDVWRSPCWTQCEPQTSQTARGSALKTINIFGD
jgi:hypothetical protein